MLTVTGNDAALVLLFTVCTAVNTILPVSEVASTVKLALEPVATMESPIFCPPPPTRPWPRRSRRRRQIAANWRW